MSKAACCTSHHHSPRPRAMGAAAAAAPPALIIPGLPNDIAMLCLSKVPRIYHACLASVCTTWRNAVSRPEFYQQRRRLGSTDAWLVIISVEILSTPTLLYSAYDLSTRQLLFKVRFPPSLPVDGHTACVKAPGATYGVDPACSISLLSVPRITAGVYTHIEISHNSSKLAHATLVKGIHVGRMPLNVAHDSRLAKGLVASSNQAQGSMSLNAANNSKAMDRTPPSAAAAPNVVAYLQNLNHFRIVAMNEYFAVLGFTQRSRLHGPMCTFTIYNTVTDEWRHARSLSICREMLACGVIDGRLYVVGGYNEKGETERTMEVYDFAADEWGTAEALPEGVGRVNGDVVYQGKLYVQCWEEGEEGKCVVWVYTPKEGKWEQLQGRHMGGQELVATDKFMYAMGGQEELLMSRYEASAGAWETVGRRGTPKLTTAAREDKVRRGQVGSSVNPHSSQRAFGHGDEIFVLQELTNGAAPCGMRCDAFTKCHRLLSVKPSWYHAGAVVQA